MTRTLTKGQTKFFEAVANGTGGVFHRRVVDPVVQAGLVFPRPGNVLFFIVGCNGHGADNFYVTEQGASELIAA